MAGDERTEDPSCRSGLCTVGDGVRLYHEIRGCGAATLLLIPGASGDGGVFAAAARCLADRFTVVAYDRRARSRSPRPAGWSRTSVDEQADDAAALLRALGLAPAHVFGTSSGATIALNLALRHPQVVRSAIAHEPPKIGVLPERDALLADLRARLQAARRRGGAAAAMADFLAWLTGPGQAVPDPQAQQTAQRILQHADVWLDVELGVVDRYDPPPALLALVQVPITIAVGSEGGTQLHQQLLQPYAEALRALAERLGARFARMNGAHVPYRTDAPKFAQQLGALLGDRTQARG